MIKILKYIVNVMLSNTKMRRDRDINSEYWNYLIILDACRYDAFLSVLKRVLKIFPVKGELRYRFSLGSSTQEYFIKEFLERIDDHRDVIYVTANPTINSLLRKARKKIFHKIIPVWLFEWDEKLGTVPPEAMYYWSLKTFLNNPNKRIIFHFIQPHFPFLSTRYSYINRLVRNDMKRAKHSGLKQESNDNSVVYVYFEFIKNIILKGAIASQSQLYLNPEINLNDVIKAYLDNLYRVLIYALRLAKILPKKVVITADHGEAFGEKLSAFIPVRVYGHPSSVHIEPLIKVPWYVIDNSDKTINESIREALRELSVTILRRLKAE